MKKILVMLVVLWSTSSLASMSSLKITGFSDLEHYILSSKIEREVYYWKNVKDFSFKKRFLYYVGAVFESLGLAGGYDDTDSDYYTLEFTATVEGKEERIKCELDIFKDMKSIGLIGCENHDIEVAHRLIFSFGDLGIKKMNF